MSKRSDDGSLAQLTDQCLARFKLSFPDATHQEISLYKPRYMMLLRMQKRHEVYFSASTLSSKSSVSQILQNEILKFFAQGTLQASVKFAALTKAIVHSRLNILLEDYLLEEAHERTALDFASTPSQITSKLIRIYAAPSNVESVRQAFGFASQDPRDPLCNKKYLKFMKRTPTSDLSALVESAKTAAFKGEIGDVTVLGVHLEDMELIERRHKKSKAMAFTFFSHHFVLCIAREGFRVYQSWGGLGYGLNEYLTLNGTRLRDWAEAVEFLKAFKLLSKPEV
ncbi:hypothetical protein MMC26_003198 [Xylographa opegraphella]|nr:hypothetical protein [Xylographa opegraphella]